MSDVISKVSLALIAIFAFLVVVGEVRAQSANAGANSGSTANSGSIAAAGNSWESNTVVKNPRTAPSLATSTTTNSRTCGMQVGAGLSFGGFGGLFNFPVIEKGCEVERAASLVHAHPSLQKKRKGEVYSQVLCQDRVAGAALTAAGETCLVGRYKNRAAVNAQKVQYVQARSGVTPRNTQVSGGNREKMRAHCLAAGVRPAGEC